MARRVWLIPLIDAVRRDPLGQTPVAGAFEAWLDRELERRGHLHGLPVDLLASLGDASLAEAAYRTYGLLNHTAHAVQLALAARGGPRDAVSDQTELIAILAHVVERPKAVAQARSLGHLDPGARSFVRGLNAVAAEVGDQLDARQVAGDHPLFGHPFHQLLRAVQTRRIVRIARVGLDDEPAVMAIDGTARSTLHRAISAAIALAVADGIVDPPEASLIEALMKAARLDPAEMAMHRAEFGAPPSAEQIAAGLGDRSTRQFVMRLLFLAAHVNGRFHDNERRLIEDIALAAGDDPGTLSRYEAAALAAYERRPDLVAQLGLGPTVGRMRRHLAQRVEGIIVDNSRKLWNEVRETGELMQLFAIASQRELSADEEAAMKSQLVDIAKAVPALALFAVPGGSILLPLLLKHLPIDLRPSSFVEDATLDTGD